MWNVSSRAAFKSDLLPTAAPNAGRRKTPPGRGPMSAHAKTPGRPTRTPPRGRVGAWGRGEKPSRAHLGRARPRETRMCGAFLREATTLPPPETALGSPAPKDGLGETSRQGRLKTTACPPPPVFSVAVTALQRTTCFRSSPPVSLCENTHKVYSGWVCSVPHGEPGPGVWWGQSFC